MRSWQKSPPTDSQAPGNGDRTLTIEFSCSHCNKVLKTSDDKAGRRAKCPQCGEPIDVPQLTQSAAEPASDGFDAFEEVVPEQKSFLAEQTAPVREEESFLSAESIDCPMCGESIPADAKRCRHCGEAIQEEVSGPRSIKVGEVFSRAWNLFKANLGQVIGIHVLAYILCVVASFVVLFVISAIGFAGLLAIAGKPDPGVMVLSVVIFYIALILVSGVVQLYFMLGVLSFLLKLVRGEQPGFNLIFSGGPYLGRMLLCSIVFFLAYLLGYLCFVIPGLIIALMFWPYPYLLIDRNLPGIDAFTDSRKITKGNLMSLFLIYLSLVGLTLVPYGLILIITIGMEQMAGQMAILGVLLVLGFMAAIYILLIPFFMLVGTVSYAEMTNQ